MLSLPSAVRVFIYTGPTDMRRSFDGLAGMAEELIGEDPLSGHLFLFRNRRRDYRRRWCSTVSHAPSAVSCRTSIRER